MRTSSLVTVVAIGSHCLFLRFRLGLCVHPTALSRWQARTLHGAPFGHRCRRHFDIAAYQDPASPNASGSDASSEAEDEMEKDGVLSEAKHEEPAVVLA